MSAPFAISLSNLTKKFGTTTALNNFSLKITSGQVVGLLGPNGSGKSTLLKILLGLLTSTSGMCELFGIPCHQVSARKNVGFLPERPTFYPFLTASETISFYGKLSGMLNKPLQQRISELLEFVGLSKMAHIPVRGYSQGMQQRLGLAQALVHDPRLLILDEPTIGLDSVGIHFFSELILELQKRGKTILFTSHLLTHVEETCDHVGIINQGQLLCYKPLKTLQHSSPPITLENFYLDALKNQ